MRAILIVLTAILLGGCAGLESGGLSEWLGATGNTARESGSEGQSRTADGIRQALQLGAQRTTTALSDEEAFAPGTRYHIALPEQLQSMAGLLRTAGYGERVDQLEQRMNEGARQAVAEATPVFRETIRDMTVRDAMAIVNGGPTAATDYFRQRTEVTLEQRFAPIVRENLRETGFYSQYRGLLDVYDAMPVTDKPDLDIEAHVLNKTLDALFHRLAAEERAIRQAPLERGSALIQSVFGA